MPKIQLIKEKDGCYSIRLKRKWWLNSYYSVMKETGEGWSLLKEKFNSYTVAFRYYESLRLNKTPSKRKEVIMEDDWKV